jgi:hypothetical protein
MMREGDKSKYQAKRVGKARHDVFREDMSEADKEFLKLDTDLRQTLREMNLQFSTESLSN